MMVVLSLPCHFCGIDGFYLTHLEDGSDVPSCGPCHVNESEKRNA